eukprot:TRINITY_DN143_c1_g2_i14.p1 TRINITY_DN143_c1_g2~~TRINITY_DN143_c1_g2_i14.p1  ORF type:complete len:640 (+),score=60.34 TRINITY_DN143_c1_g2_i14:209-1921(+)
MVAVSAYTAGLSVYTISTGATHTVPSYSWAEEAVFSPDSSRLAVAARGEGVAVVTVSTGAQLWIDATKGRCWSVAYSPDGAYVASGHDDGSVYIWNAADGSEVRALAGDSRQILALQYSTDGTKLISGATDSIVWDASSGQALHTIPSTSAATVTHVAVSPDGVYAALKTDITGVSIIKLSDYSTHLTISHGSNVYSLSFNFDSSVILVLGSGNAKIYEVSTGSQLAAIDAVGSGSFNYAGTFYNTNNLFVAGDYVVSGSGVYEFESSLRSACPSNVGSECTATIVSGLPSTARHLAVSHDDTMVAVSAYTAGLSVYAISTGATRTVPSYTVAEEAVFSPDSSRLAVAAGTEGVAVVTVSTGAQLWIDATKGTCHSVAYSPDGAYVASGHSDGRIYIWNAADGSEVRALAGDSRQILALQYSTDGTKLISGATDSIVWDASSGQALHTIPSTSAATVTHVAVSPDGVYAALKTDITGVSIIKLSDYSTHLTISHGSNVYSLSFNFDSSAILVLGSGNAKIYEVSTGSQLAAIDAVGSGSFNYAGTFYNTNNLFVAGDYVVSGSGVYEFRP